MLGIKLDIIREDLEEMYNDLVVIIAEVIWDIVRRI